MDDKDVNKFLRAADQRFTSAEILYKNGMYLDSMYIGGYTAECALKALLLARVPEREREEFSLHHLRGAISHDFEYLKGLLKRKNVDTSPVSEALRKLASWSTDLRYEVGCKSPRDAEAFLRCAREIREWVKRSL